MQTFDVHAPDLNINQNLLIEASAGTGKTYTIEQLFLRRLREPLRNCPVEPSQIAVVTFTRAAARELEERISAASSHPRLQEATIATIHSFASGLLSQFFGERPYQFVGEEELLHIVKDYFLTEDQEILPEELAKLLSVHQMSEKKLCATIAKNLYRWGPRDSLVHLMQKLEERVSQAGWSEEYVEAALEEQSLHFTGLRDRSKNLSDEAREAFQAFALLFSRVSQKEKIAALMQAPFFVETLFEKPKAKASFDQAFLTTLQKNFAPLILEAFDSDRMLERLTVRVEKFVTRRLRQLNRFTPDSLIHELEEALENPAFLTFARARFTAVFIDEFQDTDPKQWKIFSTLFLDPVFTGHLYLVGDPKQAIYSFRKADVYSYIKAKEHFPAENQATLLTNYRSSPRFIEAVNTLFQTGSGAIALPQLEQQLQIEPVKAGRSLEELHPTHAPIRFIEVRDELGRKRNWPHEGAEEKFFAAIVDEIVATKLPLSSFVILVTDRFQAERCKLFLERYGVNAATHRGTSLIESPAYQFLKRFLDLIQQPKKRGALLHLLASPPLLFPERALQKIAEDLEEWARYVDIFRAIALKKANIAAAIGEFLVCFPVTDQEFLRDLEQLIELIVEKRQKDPRTVLETLSPDIEVRFEPSESAVSIMTVFKSKGLEFDVVFALQLCARTRPSDIEQEAEKMRQFYVAVTRAKYRLYLPLLVETEERQALPGTLSPMEKFMGSTPLSEFLKEEKLFSHMLQETNAPKEAASFQNSAFSEEIRRETATFQARRLYLNSFSAHNHEYFSRMQTEESLPKGPQTGILLHRLIAELQSPKIERDWIEKKLYGTILAPHIEEVCALLNRMLDVKLDTCTLREIDFSRSFREMEFVYVDKKNSLMRGAIDFAFEHEGNFYLIDFKSNREESDHYNEQARIYCHAFQRYLKSMKIPEERLKGLFFIYLRTGGVRLWTP